MSLRRIATWVATVVTVSALAGAGWRMDGASARLDADPPRTIAASSVVWRTELPDWSNSSPVQVGNMILTAAEPTWLYAIDATTGRVLWRASSDYADTLDPAARASFQARVASLPGLERALDDTRRFLSEARKQARSASPPPDAQERMAVFAKAASELTANIDSIRRYTEPTNHQMIGFSSPSPASDGKVIVSMFGNGVVSAWSLDGRRLWVRWLGEPQVPMQGYDVGSTSSPSIVDGMVIVAHGKLSALDLATGRVIWTGPKWPHYGSPTVTRVGGVAVVITPDGDVLRASDGLVMASKLSHLMFVGAVAVGDRVFFVGTFDDGFVTDNNEAAAFKLSLSGAQVTATALWRTHIPATDPIYAAPAYDGRFLYVASRDGAWFVLDADSGSIVSAALFPKRTTAAGPIESRIYANPVVTRSSVLVASDSGEFWFGDRGAGFSPPAPAVVDETFRTTPLPVGDRWVVRQYKALVCYGR